MVNHTSGSVIYINTVITPPALDLVITLLPVLVLVTITPLVLVLVITIPPVLDSVIAPSPVPELVDKNIRTVEAPERRVTSSVAVVQEKKLVSSAMVPTHLMFHVQCRQRRIIPLVHTNRAC